MLHAEKLTLNARGLRASHSYLRSIGVFSRSVCWVARVAAPKDLAHENYRQQAEHLILSPISPVSWPFLIQLEICLEDKDQVFAKAAAAVAQCGIEVLASECVPYGYKHMVWNIVGTPEGAAKIRKKLRMNLQKDSTHKIPKNNVAKLAAIMTAITESSSNLLDAIAKCDAAAGSPWLRDRQLNSRMVLIDNMASDDEEAAEIQRQVEHDAHGHILKDFEEAVRRTKDDERTCSDGDSQQRILENALKIVDGVTDESAAEETAPRSHVRAPIKARWLSRMAYFGLSDFSSDAQTTSADLPTDPDEASKAQSPTQGQPRGCAGSFSDAARGGQRIEQRVIQMTCDAEGNILHHNAEEQWSTLSQLDSCNQAIATFHTSDKYARIEPIRESELTRVIFPYECSLHENHTTLGVLSTIASTLGEKFRRNMIHHSSSSSYSDEHSERGEVRFALHVPPVDAKKAAEHVRSESQRKLNSDEGENPPESALGNKVAAKLHDVRCEPIARPTLFISMREPKRHLFDRWHRDLIVEAAEKAGFTPQPNTDVTQNITDGIINSIRESSALLLVGTNRTPEDADRKIVLGWLSSEYAIARTLGKPVVRVVDSTAGIDWKDELAFDGDRHIRTIPFSAPTIFRKEMTEILHQLYSATVKSLFR